MSRVVSLIFLVIGIVFGLYSENITKSMMFLVGGLYGGFAIANVLKWYWWRFNGYGYFWGMIGGVGSALSVAPSAAHFILGHDVSNSLYLFPPIFALSVVGSFLGTWLTKPGRMRKRFEKILPHCVNPWGAWGPIPRKK